MLSLQILPAALVALMWASPAFAAAPVSRNDPFRAIALQVPRRPDPPVCCLKPLAPLEPVEDEVFLSFEEWKAKQSMIQEQARAKERSDMLNRSSNGNKGAGGVGNGSETTSLSVDLPAMGDPFKIEETTNSQLNEPVSPHFRVPLTDRFNYASLDCSARVHASHRSAKSSSSILSSKRDRYMLSPCNSRKGEQQYVVVELCEDIRIDTVQLANFEFFSGVFKDFGVSVAKTYTGKEDDWTLAGTYMAKNVRGVQSFHPPTSLRDFYRYIRIDFLSHYSNEFYCPVSLLRVYGLTHLEQWKWDMWEEQSRAKRDELDKATDLQPPSPPVEVVTDVHIPAHVAPGLNEPSINPETLDNLSPLNASPALQHNTESSAVSSASYKASTPTFSATTSALTISNSEATSSGTSSTANSKPTTITSVPATNDIHEHSSSIQNTPTHSLHNSSSSNTLTSSSSSQTPNMSYAVQHNQTPKPSPVDSATSNSSSLRLASSTSPPPSPSATTTIITHMASVPASVPVIVPPIVPSGGESIYRTIMNRLTALEANHTLYTRYVEQQTSGVRDVLKRLGEDIGRLEGIGRAQTVTFQRTVNEWEARQQKLQMDYGELMSRVEYLSDEIVLEKRLGIAQLCLLLAVLIFMGLTRGSRGEPFMEHGSVQLNKSMREWGKRHLSFSGDWTTRFKGRGRNSIRSPPKPNPDAKPLPKIFSGEDIKIAFPAKEIWKREPLETSNLNSLPTPVEFHNHTRFDSRSRTPSMRNRHHRPITPTLSTFRPRQLQRSNSQGGGTQNGGSTGGTITVPRSARKWARTPHLHEVRNGDGRRERRRDHGRSDRENELEDVFSVPATAPASVPRYSRRDDGFNPTTPKSHQKGNTTKLNFSDLLKTEDGEGDPWVDTEEEPEADWDTKVEPGRSITFSGNEH